MSSFGSSVISKGGRKIAPKAPVRRRQPATNASQAAQTPPEAPIPSQNDIQPSQSAAGADKPANVAAPTPASTNIPSPVEKPQTAQTEATPPPTQSSTAILPTPPSTQPIANAPLPNDATQPATTESQTSGQTSAADTTTEDSRKGKERAAPDVADGERSPKRRRIESSGPPATPAANATQIPTGTGTASGTTGSAHAETVQASAQQESEAATNITAPSNAASPSTAAKLNKVQSARVTKKSTKESEATKDASAKKAAAIMKAVQATTERSAKGGAPDPNLVQQRSRKGKAPQTDDDDESATEETPVAQSSSANGVPPMIILENGVAKKPRKQRSDKGKPKKRIPRAPVEGQENANEETNVGAEEDTPALRGRKKRAETPEGNENILIDPGTVIMNELTRDARHGKLSEREKKMRELNWDDIHSRRKEALWKDPKPHKSNVDKDTEASELARQCSEAAAAAGPGEGPTMQINERGDIVMVEGSTRIDRRKRQEQEDAAREVVEEDDLARRINSHTWRFANAKTAEDRIPGNRRGRRWGEEETDRFYDAIKMFGTDFMMISKMFEGRNRRQIKAKFVSEEKSNPERIKAAFIGEREEMNWDYYLRETNLEESDFKDPETIKEELRMAAEEQRREIEEARLRFAEDERQRGEAEKLQKEQGEKKKRERKKKKGEMDIGGEEVEVVEEGLF